LHGCESLKLQLEFEPRHGSAVDLGNNVRRVTAVNPGPFTFHGTNTFIVGKDELAVIDPGPALDQHFDALLAAIAGRRVSHIFVTHTHLDHTGLLERLVDQTGAKTFAQGPHRAARDLHNGETNVLDASSDRSFAPDVLLNDGQIISGDGWQLEAVHTPGHTANHCAFALKGSGILFSGDHVMGWSTSIVAPPDGSMSDYLASLDKLLRRDDRTYLSGHGGEITNPRSFVKALKTHRKMRERAVLQRVRQGDTSITDIVVSIYREINPKLLGAAALSVLAHLEDLIDRGLIRSDGPASLDGFYFPG
jgi:glyoxylase-like metal-dependent hydrolase (beta-lactamase superfamily II)